MENTAEEKHTHFPNTDRSSRALDTAALKKSLVSDLKGSACVTWIDHYPRSLWLTLGWGFELPGGQNLSSLNP